MTTEKGGRPTVAPEIKRANKRAWSVANASKVRASRAAWKARNPEKIAAYEMSRDRAKCNIAQAKWRRSNAHVVASNQAKRRAAAKLATPSWADISLIADLYKYAAIMRVHGVVCEVDHVVPLRGRAVCGFHSHDNLSVALKRSNRSKGNRHDEAA